MKDASWLFVSVKWMVRKVARPFAVNNSSNHRATTSNTSLKSLFCLNCPRNNWMTPDQGRRNRTVSWLFSGVSLASLCLQPLSRRKWVIVMKPVGFVIECVSKWYSERTNKWYLAFFRFVSLLDVFHPYFLLKEHRPDQASLFLTARGAELFYVETAFCAMEIFFFFQWGCVAWRRGWWRRSRHHRLPSRLVYLFPFLINYVAGHWHHGLFPYDKRLGSCLYHQATYCQSNDSSSEGFMNIIFFQCSCQHVAQCTLSNLQMNFWS